MGGCVTSLWNAWCRQAARCAAATTTCNFSCWACWLLLAALAVANASLQLLRLSMPRSLAGCCLHSNAALAQREGRQVSTDRTGRVMFRSRNQAARQVLTVAPAHTSKVVTYPAFSLLLTRIPWLVVAPPPSSRHQEAGQVPQEAGAAAAQRGHGGWLLSRGGGC